MASKEKHNVKILLIFYFLLVDKNNLNNDFYLLNYWQDINSALTVAKRILDYQFDYSAVRLLRGADSLCTFTHGKFRKRLKDLFTKFYTQNGKPIGVIAIPIFTQFDKPGITSWEKAMGILQEW